jgi:uncharacterized protein (TIGR02246 family)
MRIGNIEAVLRLYDPEVAFVNAAGEVRAGLDQLRQEPAPVAAERPRFDFEVKQVARAGNIALMHTWWQVSVGEQESKSVHAIEVARRQSDGDWRWLIGDSFSVGRLANGRAG